MKSREECHAQQASSYEGWGWWGAIGRPAGSPTRVTSVHAQLRGAETRAACSRTRPNFGWKLWNQVDAKLKWQSEACWWVGGRGWEPCRANLHQISRGLLFFSDKDAAVVPILCRNSWKYQTHLRARARKTFGGCTLNLAATHRATERSIMRAFWCFFTFSWFYYPKTCLPGVTGTSRRDIWGWNKSTWAARPLSLQIDTLVKCFVFARVLESEYFINLFGGNWVRSGCS